MRSDWLLSGQDFLVMTGHYKNFSRRDGYFGVVSKSYERGRKQQQKSHKISAIFSITERKILAYQYFFSMSDEDSHSESEFYYPEEEEQAKNCSRTEK